MRVRQDLVLAGRDNGTAEAEAGGGVLQSEGDVVGEPIASEGVDGDGDRWRRRAWRGLRGRPGARNRAAER